MSSGGYGLKPSWSTGSNGRGGGSDGIGGGGAKGRNGGAGAVIIRYSADYPPLVNDSSVAYEVLDGYRIYQILIDGNITFSTNFTSSEIPFPGCQSVITEDDFPRSCTEIPDDAFNGCNSLYEITVPETITKIGKRAFKNCRNMKSFVKLGNDEVTYIGEKAFEECRALRSDNFTLPFRVSKIEERVFYRTGLSVFHVPESVTIIGHSAFADSTRLKTVTLPSNLTELEDWAFYQTGLAEINIPHSTRRIGIYMFAGCYSLESIHIPGSVQSIGYRILYRVPNLKSATFGEGISSVPSSTFYQSRKLESVLLPSTLRYIYSEAFKECDSLNSINIPPGVVSISYSAFQDCKSLASVSLPSALTNIGSGAFKGCTSLVRVTIPKLLGYINSESFSGCTSLKSVSLLGVGTSMSYSAFSNCPKLTCVYGSSNQANYVGATQCFPDCDAGPIVSVNMFPLNATAVPSNQFFGCSTLKEVHLPANVTEIGSSAFEACSNLTEIILYGEDVAIGVNAFAACNKLQCVWTFGDTQTVVSRVIDAGAPNALACTYSPTATPTMMPSVSVDFVNFPINLTVENLTETNSARENVATARFVACDGDSFILSTCSEDTDGDTYIRLFQDDIEVAADDDSMCTYSGLHSKISYGVGSSNATDDAAYCYSYRLDIGCYSNSQCTVNVLGNGNVTKPSDYVRPWSSCPNVDIAERITYDDMDFNPIKGKLTITNPPVGFFKLVRKVAIYAMRRSPRQEDSVSYIAKRKIKITPGTSKFPLKFEPFTSEDAQRINYVRVKIIGNRVKAEAGKRAHPYWECAEKPYYHNIQRFYLNE